MGEGSSNFLALHKGENKTKIYALQGRECPVFAWHLKTGPVCKDLDF